MPDGTIPPDAVLDAALQGFQGTIQSFLPGLLTWGSLILTAVVFCGLGYALLMAISNHDWFGMMMGMAYAFARIMVIEMLYQNFSSIGGISNAMSSTVGQSVSGLSPASLTPSALYSTGITIVNLLFHARHDGSWFNLVADMEFLSLIVLTLVTWFSIAMRYLFTIVEAEWIFVKGAITVCFAAFPQTFPTLENWAVQMIRVAVRLIAVLLIVAIGLALAEDWTSTLAGLGDSINTNSAYYGATQAAEAILLLWAIWKLPQKADALITSSGSSGSLMEAQSGREVYDAAVGGAARGARALL